VLTHLGYAPEVSAQSYRANRLLVVSPNGTEVRFSTTFWVLPRLALDQFLFSKAIEAGAEFRRLIVDAPLREGDRVIGISAREAGSEAPVELRAPLTLLATGAAAGVLRKFDPAARLEPSGYAIRAYAEQPARELTELMISLDRELLPGYAWAFPAPDGLINIGIGALRSQRLREDSVNLRKLMDRLVAGEGSLGRILGPLRITQPYQGAPLRTGLLGSTMHRPGLVIIGEAAGTTYALTGEGIGKAMESGLLAAELAIAAGSDPSAIGARYKELMFARHGARFRTYEIAQQWMRFPRFADFVARRAQRSAWLHDRLTGILTERPLPPRVFSLRTFWRLMREG
jgi:flavin-dependent dehydrogenase